MLIQITGIVIIICLTILLSVSMVCSTVEKIHKDKEIK